VGSPYIFLSERDPGNLSILGRLQIGKIVAYEIKIYFLFLKFLVPAQVPSKLLLVMYRGRVS
jgi:hypothetical protein